MKGAGRSICLAVPWRAGHRSIETAWSFTTQHDFDVYGHLYHELQNDAAKIMDDLVVPSATQAPFTITVP